MSVAKNGAVHMAVAFLAMGGWAVFANRGHPWPDPLLAGLVQGTISAVITLFLKRMIEAASRRLPGHAALIGPPVLAALTSVIVLTVLHRLAETPELWRTIAVPLTVTTVYASTYSLALWRDRHDRT